IVFGQGEEHGLLVAEVVEDRSARQPGGLFQPAHGRPFVSELAEAPPGAVEDLGAAGGTSVFSGIGHATDHSGFPVRPLCSRCAPCRISRWCGYRRAMML